MSQTFGIALKDWRVRRRMSQMDLGLSADVSARHISFLETGRSRPSRTMVLQLCEELDVPRQSRNHLLSAAGLADAYSKRDLSEADMEPVRAAVEWMLERHNPFPALAMDKHWNIVKMNNTATLLMGGLGVCEGDSTLTALAENDAARDAIENYQEVLEHTITRLRTENSYLGGDEVLSAAIEKLTACLTGDHIQSDDVLPAFIPARFVSNGMRFSLFSTFSQFGSAEDIALSELKIEMMFPADQDTRDLLTTLATA